MALSVFDLFSIGIGPSSSHTVGPMRASRMFLQALQESGDDEQVARLRITLYGSLASTGKGHGTDKAIILGLTGETPEHTNPRETISIVQSISQKKKIALAFGREISFIPERDFIFEGLKELPLHPNGIKFSALNEAGKTLLSRHYYSIGGGFVLDETSADGSRDLEDHEVPYPFNTGAQLMALCQETGYSIAKIVLENELTFRSHEEIYAGLDEIWKTMNESIDAGCETEGMLPGSLRVLRRAPALHQKLTAEGRTPDPLCGMDWITLYAMAVNEENAAGGRVVTAPTNGAAGVIPAVLRYYLHFINGADVAGVRRFLLTAAAICIIVKTNASISGAEVGCQGEVGVACSMAAAGLTAVLGGSAKQVENAAEIGMEHNLGLTCDPVGGYVQVPCIERNAIAAIKAVAAARTALRGDGTHVVSLDDVVKTMRDTGRDMQSKYKETSLGGLAVNVTEC